ncbi:MAG: NAD(P)-binding protein [Caldisphaera sp.]|jgi:flavin-dependent dehydrogenase|nr:NAD(P)/FAD-dependent oxidoreductase [Caldisphaera sp.]PMP90382.1 MAG: NAD(P)/FAD-dependent oxidoreductase [Caldisphaera sp.]
MSNEISIIGAGPAGASMAYRLARSGYKVKVYEVNKKLALKPCGLGIPSSDDLPIKIKKEHIVRVIRGATLYVDEIKVLDKDNFLEGYIINKESFLEDLIIESGAELYRGSSFNYGNLTVKENGEIKKIEKGILAGGFPFYNGEKIDAVQIIVKSNEYENLNKLLIYFDTEIVGYYWVFPGIDGIEVGVGGYRNAIELTKLLLKFIDNKINDAKMISPIRGAKISVGGVKIDDEKLIKIGESAGFVLPLTGEGIRPSIISGYEAADLMIKGVNIKNGLEELKIKEAISMQRRILERVKSMNRERRRELLSSMPAEVHAEVALGKMNKTNIIKALAKRPDLAIKLLNYMRG